MRPAILDALRAGLFRRENWMSDITAGLVVGIVALPLAMAFAIASGVPPVNGLYTALVAGVVVTLLGGSRVQIAGPTGAFAVLLSGIAGRYGIGGLAIVTLLAGLILIAMGLARMGAVIRFIPESVILGFTAGVAVVIWVGQWSSFLGLPAATGEHFHEKLLQIVSMMPRVHPLTAALGVGCLALLLIWPRIPVLGRAPAPLVTLVVATVVQVALRPAGVATIGSVFGGVPLGLPSFVAPRLTYSMVTQLAQPAFAVALLGAIESLLSATVADGMTGTRHDPNQELIGQGLANVAASLFGGFAATGAVARTATNVRHGARSPLAGLVHAGVVAIVLLALAPLAYNVPLAALAAVLFVVAFNMSGVKHVLRTARRAPVTDVAVMFVTMGLTVFTDLVLAVEVGVILALLNFMRRMASSVEVSTMGTGELAAALPGEAPAVPRGVLVYTVEGPFFFGAVDQFEQALLHTHTEPRGLVISLERVPFIDLTGLDTLAEVVSTLRARGIRVAVCLANRAVAARLERSDIASSLDATPACDLSEAIAAVAPATRPHAA